MPGARTLHRWFSYAVFIPALMLAVTGVGLSMVPLKEGLSTGSLSAAPAISVAALMDTVDQSVPGAEHISKSANHTVSVDYSTADAFGTAILDPVTGTTTERAASSGFWGGLKDLHRSMFLGDGGRATVGVTAAGLLAITITGLWILVTRMGGWRAVLFPPKATGVRWLHLAALRVALPGLLLAGATGVILSLSTFSVLPEPSMPNPAWPDLAGDPAIAYADMPALQAVQLADLRDLVLPFPGDSFSPIELTTSSGTAFVDPSTGEVTAFEAFGPGAKFYQFIYLLHTGQGAWWLGILLGLSVLAVPVATVSGVAMALTRPRSPLRGIRMTGVAKADDVILVGSEGGTTWAFAAELGRKLIATGRKVHIAPMNDLSRAHIGGENLFILAATFGNGAAPQSAARFLDRLDGMAGGGARVTVLGFGDRKYPDFCGFAHAVDNALHRADFAELVPFAAIDRQNAQAFADWGRTVGDALGLELELSVSNAPAKTATLELVSNQKFGEEVQAPVSILRFSTPRFGLGRFSAGDIVGILAPGSDVPRYYSLASSRSDGFLEICVRRQPGGLCSSFLTGLEAGARVEAFIKPNPEFRAAKSQKPLILIGAGAGIAPLVGFLRALKGGRPVHLYWGGRLPGSDFLYEDELKAMQAKGWLTGLKTAFSRSSAPAYVTSRLRDNAEDIRGLVEQGADIMICGGLKMATDVGDVLDSILCQPGMTLAEVRARKGYLQDVY